MEIILANLSAFGVSEAIISVGYRSELIKTYFGDGAQIGMQLSYVHEDAPLGTAGPLALVREQFSFHPRESLLLMNGDILTEFDFARFMSYHRDSRNEITVATRTHHDRLPFGVIDLGEDGSIRKIVEKPTVAYEVSAGIYALQSSILADVPAGAAMDMPDLIGKLLSEGRKVGAYHFDDYWLSVDRIQDIEEALTHVPPAGRVAASVKPE